MTRFLRSRTAASLAVIGAVTGTSFAVTLLPGAAPIAAAKGLTPYTDCTELLNAYRARLVKQATQFGRGFAVGSTTGGAVAERLSGAPMASQDSAKGVGTSGTGTNVQEAGVDEPDTAKLAGEVLVVAAGRTVQVVKPGPDPAVLGSVSLGEQAWGAQLLVDGTRVLALSGSGGYGIAEAGLAMDSVRGMPYGGGYGHVVLTLIDIADPRNPRVIETSTTDGNLLSARLADGRARVVISTTAQPQPVPYERKGVPVPDRVRIRQLQQAAAQIPLARVLPQRERKAASGRILEKGQAVECGDVAYSKGAGGTTTLTLSTLDLQKSLAPTGSAGVNADGDMVYATAGSVYVATSRWGWGLESRSAPAEVTTEVHSFSLTPTDATYRATGSVPGHLLNSYSLSEHEGHLRVVTTREGTTTSASLLVLKDNGSGDLALTGRVDGLGKTERVYAVRFLGDIATVVTFRQTDPLYTLDLSNPGAPRVLGELKIPGFSNYLHPVGADTLVGVGSSADLEGRVTGLQVATFDIGDLSKPRRTRVLDLGHGWSDAAHDPHAFAYHPSLRLMTIPVGDNQGRTVLVGLRVSAGELGEVGRVADANGGHPQRALLVDGVVHLVSDQGITSARVGDLSPLGSVRFRL